MMKYFKIGWRTWTLSWMQMMAYRINLLFFVLSNLVFSISEILLVWFLFHAGQVDTIAGFTVYQFYFVMALGQIVQMIGWMLAGKSTWRLRQAIHFGELDFILTKPGNIIFLVSFSQYWIAQIGATFISSFFLLWIASPHLMIDWSVERIFQLAFILGVSVVVFWVIFWCATLVWFFWPRFDGLRSFMDITSDAIFYPQRIYPSYMRWFLVYIFPIFLVANPIFHWLNGVYDYRMMLHDGGVTIIFLLIFLIMWRGGLKRYNSAN